MGHLHDLFINLKYLLFHDRNCDRDSGLHYNDTLYPL